MSFPRRWRPGVGWCWCDLFRGGARQVVELPEQPDHEHRQPVQLAKLDFPGAAGVGPRCGDSEQDLYSNSIRKISGLSACTTLRVLMLGKNHIQKIEGLESLSRLDVLDLHSNKISVIGAPLAWVCP